MKNFTVKSGKFCAVLLLLLGCAGFLIGFYTHIRFSKAAYIPRFNDQILLPGKNDFKVAVFGDFAMQNGAVEPIMQAISASDVDIAICSGDMFRHPGTGAALYLKELFEKNLHKPYFCVAGNHDVDDGKGALTCYRLFGGTEQYHFVCGDTLFIALDTSDAGFCDQRKTWLLDTLEAFRKNYRRCIIVTHTPPVASEYLGSYFNKQLADVLDKIVEQYNISGLICGHLHIAETLNFKGVPVYISQSSGQKIRDKAHRHFGYLELHFKSDGSVVGNYIYKPELKRSRNYFYGFILENIYGNTKFFVFSALLFAFGAVSLAAYSWSARRAVGRGAGHCLEK